MVEVIQLSETYHASYGGGHPLVHIHHIARDVHGNGIAIRVYGEVKIAAKEILWARELKLNTIQVLVLTAESGDHGMYVPKKWIYHKGAYDNYASIDILGADAYEYVAGSRTTAVTAPNQLPYDGSIWLNFIALGE